MHDRTRLAFILPNPDRSLLLSVLARATTLWGGVFNPIVILDNSTRKAFGMHYGLFRSDPYLTIQSDMLKAFDPDLLINFSSDPLPPQLKAWQHRTFTQDHLDWRPVEYGYEVLFCRHLPRS